MASYQCQHADAAFPKNPSSGGARGNSLGILCDIGQLIESAGRRELRICRSKLAVCLLSTYLISSALAILGLYCGCKLGRMLHSINSSIQGMDLL